MGKKMLPVSMGLLLAAVLGLASNVNAGSIAPVTDAVVVSTDLFSTPLTVNWITQVISGGNVVSGHFTIKHPVSYVGTDHYNVDVTFDNATHIATGSLDVTNTGSTKIYHSTNLLQFDLAALNDALGDGPTMGAFYISFAADNSSTVPVGMRLVTEAFQSTGQANTFSVAAPSVPTPAALGGGTLLMGALGLCRKRRITAVSK